MSNHTKSCGCLKTKEFKKRIKKYNTYDLTGEYGIGYTEDNKVYYFDIEDYQKIKNYYWYIDNKGYVITQLGTSFMEMHRWVMNCPKNKLVDHIQHVNHDNRKEKLRICDKSKNGMNMRLPSDNTSGCKGVVWHKRYNLWSIRITVNKKRVYLGYSKDYDEAVRIRKEAEEKYFGEYSYDNSMREVY